MNDVPRVGGKNASLGEMISNLGSLGVEVPDGFATTAHAFDDFLDQAGIRERIHQRLDRLDTEDVRELALAGAEIRGWVIDSPLPDNLQQEISVAYRAMSANGKEATVAVRSSATAEDLPDASFAGQQETFLNISGLEQVLHSDQAGVRLAVQRPRNFLPGAPGLRTRRRGVVGRDTAHGAQRPGGQRRHVQYRYRIRIRGCRFHHQQLWPR
jgi:phosphoenolpyruvate synthase/pyruvate phosphate dikinase